VVVDVGGASVGAALFEPVSAGVLEAGGGGGSMSVGAGEGFDTGSGREDKGSSADDVSIVTCSVVGGDERSV
jgi:hypothetical protein